MLAASLHPEDIKAILRKRHRTIAAFADAKGIKAQGVADYLRGRTSSHVATVIEEELQAAHLEGTESIKLDDSAETSDAHRLNVGAR